MKNQSNNTPAFPIIHTVQGGPSEDGNMLLVEAATFEDKVLRFAIPIDNVQYFIAFLLIWVGKISAAQENRSETDDTEGASLPIPATSISIGEPHGDEGYLGISVGRAELTFSVPASALLSVGKTLLIHARPAQHPRHGCESRGRLQVAGGRLGGHHDGPRPADADGPRRLRSSSAH